MNRMNDKKPVSLLCGSVRCKHPNGCSYKTGVAVERNQSYYGLGCECQKPTS